MKSVNPATGAVIEEYAEHDHEEVAARIGVAHDRWAEWRRVGFEERARLMRAAAAVLTERLEPLAETMTMEMGKTISAARAEVEKCAWVCRYYADNAELILADHHIETERSESFVHHEPLGVVLAVMPWNFPLWQVLRFAAPALMAGNVALLKHASNVSGTALAIEDLFDRAGFPEGCFSTLLIPGGRVAEVIEDDRVAAVTLTGSGPAGSAVASKAGELIKKTVLELGGSDASVILEDADLDLAAENCALGRMINNGQSCIAAKRFVVVDAVYDDWLDKFSATMSEYQMGDPMAEETNLGPQARPDLRDELHDQVARSVESGANVLIGGEIPEAPGAWYPATILTDVGPGMPAYDEELFGPVASVIRVADEEEAVRVANDTEFGLGAAVYTRDIGKGRDIATTRLRAGSCFVNAIVGSDPRLPFGGVKKSGYGRELSEQGIKEFVNEKTVVVA